MESSAIQEFEERRCLPAPLSEVDSVQAEAMQPYVLSRQTSSVTVCPSIGVASDAESREINVHAVKAFAEVRESVFRPLTEIILMQREELKRRIDIDRQLLERCNAIWTAHFEGKPKGNGKDK